MSITEDLHKFANFKTFNEAKKKEVKKEEEDGDTKKDHPVLKKIKQKLDIKDKEIQEIYKDDPKKLANDLAKAVGDEQVATGLLAYMANVLGSNEKDIFEFFSR